MALIKLPFRLNFRAIKVGGQDWGSTLVFAVTAGFVVIFLYSLGPNFNESDSVHLAIGLLLSGACLLGGVFCGFLFGIPRFLQAENLPSKAEADAAGTNGGAQGRFEYRANTNLEQISDWLTKILVGVGLTQMNKLPGLFDRAGSYFGPAIGAAENGSKLAVVIILYFSITGFLLGYLWTRIFLGGELVKGETLALEAVAARVQTIEAQRDEQSQRDAKAISMTYQYLAGTNENKFSAGDLKAAIIKASAPIKVQLFYQAEALRARSWRRPEDKAALERTIPIFEALIASDIEGAFHANYGQLGFALKDKREPNYPGAVEALTKAIIIRGPAGENGWASYEFVRAVCRIKIEMQTIGNTPSTQETRNQIWDDLDTVNKVNPDMIPGSSIEGDLKKWQDLNPR
jgi:hypothetical protein